MLFRDFFNSIAKNYILRYTYYTFIIFLLLGNYYSFLDNFVVKVFIFLTAIIISRFLCMYYLQRRFFNDFLILKFFFKQSNVSIITNYILFYIKNINNFLKSYKINTSNLTWKPLFKKNGYFLNYRANRTIWSNTRTEENNNIKLY